MMIHEITALAGKYKSRKRVGRGPGSGTGKRAGRGQKGAGSRTGHSTRFQFEGGQMPYFRRMPKFGFSNAKFRVNFWLVNLRQIVQHPAFAGGGDVTNESLIAAGLVRDDSREVKVLGDLPEGVESLSVKLNVKVNRVTDPARKLIEAAGGSVHETGTRRDAVRGVDRNSDDRSPSNQTKKAKRRAYQQKKAEAAARGEALKKS
ncbi:MAG: 50S ribosomal protein L15 [Phycisphaeraceae bacterium]|nr:MAG: 50S ribosomal protein L15 [Phycisphaeraceae bacterium]